MSPFLQMRELNLRKLYKFASTKQNQALNQDPPLPGSKAQALIRMSFSKYKALRGKHRASALSHRSTTCAVPQTKNGPDVGVFN